jgi:hypothetical protein
MLGSGVVCWNVCHRIADFGSCLIPNSKVRGQRGSLFVPQLSIARKSAVDIIRSQAGTPSVQKNQLIMRTSAAALAHPVVIEQNLQKYKHTRSHIVVLKLTGLRERHSRKLSVGPRIRSSLWECSAEKAVLTRSHVVKYQAQRSIVDIRQSASVSQ